MGSTIETGAYGELKAVEYLRREGFSIMETNWRSGRYEIDIIAERGDTIHFVEVKYRGRGSLTTPEEAVTRKKATNLLRAANHYISLHEIDRECRMDVIAIDEQPDGSLDLRYIPDAIEPRW